MTGLTDVVVHLDLISGVGRPQSLASAVKKGLCLADGGAGPSAGPINGDVSLGNFIRQPGDNNRRYQRGKSKRVSTDSRTYLAPILCYPDTKKRAG